MKWRTNLAMFTSSLCLLALITTIIQYAQGNELPMITIITWSIAILANMLWIPVLRYERI
jgi:hypothetical protein